MIKKYLLLIALILASGTTVHAQLSVLKGPQGGTGIGTTGAGNIGNCLKVSAVSPALVWTVGSCGAGGAGTPGGSSGDFQFNDANSFGGTTTPFFLNFGFGKATGTSATTSNFFSTTASSTNLFGQLINGFGLSTCTSATVSLTWTGGSFGCHTITPTAGSITNGAALTKVDDTNVTLTLGGAPSTSLLSATSLTLGWTGTLADSRVADNLTISGGTIDNSVIGGTTAAAGTFTNLLVTGSSTLQNFTALQSTSTQATTSSFFSTKGSFDKVCLTSDTCRTTWPAAGTSASTTLLTDNNHFTVGSNSIDNLTTIVSTTTNFMATGSSTLQNFTGLNSTTTNSTTTIASFTTASTTNFTISGIKSALVLTNVNGTASGYGGASACSSSNFVTAISAVGGTTCGTATISGVNLGSNLGALTNGATLLGSSYNGSGAISDWDIDLSNQNVWTAASTTFTGTLTAVNFVAQVATTTNLLVTASSTFQNFTGVNATTTTMSHTKASTTSFWLSGAGYALTNCLQVDITGKVSGTGNTCGGSSKWATSTDVNYTANTGISPSGAFFVGIGTTTPKWALQIATSTRAQLTLTDSINTDHWSFRDSNNNFYLATSSPTTFATSTVPALMINTNGYVGIGTTSPLQRFSVNGGVHISDTIFLATTSDVSGIFATGLNIATSTAIRGGQFANTIASSTTASMTNLLINWNTGNTQRIRLDANATVVINATSSNPIDGGKYILKACQDGTGSRTLTFITPGQLRWPTLGATPGATTTISSAANSCSFIGFIYDATFQTYSAMGSTTGVKIN